MLVRRLVTAGAVAALLTIAPPSARVVAARQSPAPDPFARLAPLIGRWTGTAQGQPGQGTSEREYTRALGDRFIRVRNSSRYPPQTANPKGENHEDEGVISADRARKVLVFRQFHSEGFVNQYVEAPDSTAQRVVFVSEAIENIPAGWRAKETYILTAPDAFEEVFELAEPGKPFEVYSRTRFTRSK